MRGEEQRRTDLKNHPSTKIGASDLNERKEINAGLATHPISRSFSESNMMSCAPRFDSPFMCVLTYGKFGCSALNSHV
jgi:hypothetical protein